MLAWFFRFIVRYAVFSTAVIAVGQGWTWLYGLEAEVKGWIAENRSLVSIVLILSILIYGMYDWLEEDDK